MNGNDADAAMGAYGQTGRPHGAYAAHEASGGGISTKTIVNIIAMAIPKMALGLLLGAVLAIGVLTALRWVMPPLATYRSGVTITMSSATDGRYPNGAKFAFTDLRSPLVLDEVYRQNDLGTYGLKLEDFVGMISVSPYSPAFQSAVVRFQAQLANKTLTFEERRSIEEDFRNTINSLNSTGMLVSFTVPDAGKIPENLAKKVVDDIPAKWAEIYIERLGVANMPLPASGADIVDADLIGTLDYPLAYDYLTSRVDIVLGQIQSLQNYSGFLTFVSEKSGKSIDDLQRSLDSLAEFKLALGLRPLVDAGLSKDPVATSAIYENLTRNLEQDSISQREYSRRVSGILQDHASNATQPEIPLAGAGASNQSGTGTVVTLGQPVDGSLIDRVVRLSNRSAEFAFEKVLLEKKLDLENAGVRFDDKKARMAYRRSAIQNSPLSVGDRVKREDEFKKGLTVSTTTLNQIWRDVLTMTDEINLNRFNNDKVLYSLSNLPDDIRLDRPTVLTINNLLLAFLLPLVGLVLGLLSSLWRQFMRPLP